MALKQWNLAKTAILLPKTAFNLGVLRNKLLRSRHANNISLLIDPNAPRTLLKAVINVLVKKIRRKCF